MPSLEWYDWYHVITWLLYTELFVTGIIVKLQILCMLTKCSPNSIVKPYTSQQSFVLFIFMNPNTRMIYLQVVGYSLHLLCIEKNKTSYKESIYKINITWNMLSYSLLVIAQKSLKTVLLLYSNTASKGDVFFPPFPWPSISKKDCHCFQLFNSHLFI